MRHVSYLLLDVVKRIGRVDGEADEDNVRVGVGERAETVVIFLASGIPKGELDVLAVNLYIGDVVLEDGGDVDLEYTGQFDQNFDRLSRYRVDYGLWIMDRIR